MAENLWGQEIIAAAEMRRNWTRRSTWLTGLLLGQGVDRIRAGLTVPPGMDELFSLLQIKKPTILVGKKATYDGSTMIARNDDSGSGHFTAKKFTVVSPAQQPKTYHSVLSHVSIIIWIGFNPNTGLAANTG